MAVKPINILKCLFIYVFILHCDMLWGQSYLVHRYTEAEGLPSATVYDITQDKAGRIWVATRSGIASYDGVAWEKYNVEDGLPVLSFSRVKIEGKKRIWAMGQTNYSICFAENLENPTWYCIDNVMATIPPDMYFTCIELIEMYINGSKLPVICVGTSKYGVFLLVGKIWKRIDMSSGLPDNRVNALLANGNTLYTATNKGLTEIRVDSSGNINVDNRINTSLNLPPGSIEALCFEDKNKYKGYHSNQSRIWLYTHEWLGYFDEKTLVKKIYTVRAPLVRKEDSVSIQYDYRNGVYLGSHYQLLYFNCKTLLWEEILPEAGLAGGGSNALFIDREKNIWIACDRGLSNIVSRRFTNFNSKSGLLENEVTSILEYEPGKFVMGHNIGLTFYNGHRFTALPLIPKDIKDLVLFRVLEMRNDSQKNIWVAFSKGGLLKISPNKKVTNYGLPQKCEKVTSVFVDKTDRVIVGTDKGAFILKSSGFTRVEDSPETSIRRLFGHSGTLGYIAGMGTGIYAFQSDKWVNYRTRTDSMANSVYCLIEYHRNYILAGTLKGLYTIKNNTLEPVSFSSVIENRPVYSILAEPGRTLWFGTDNGTVRWNGEEARRYSINQGLIGQETNRDAFIKDSRGRVWIGTNNGISIYDGAFDSPLSETTPPYVYLLRIETPGKKIPLLPSSPIELSYSENNVTFYFRGISFEDEKAIRFKSKLEGYDNDWSEESYPYNQAIRYSNLPFGKYNFCIKARNASGVWSDVVKSGRITIFRPFYLQWWFFLLLLVVIGSILYSISRYFAEKRYSANLEREVIERTDQLQTVEKQYRIIFEESKDMVFISTPDGRFIDINPAGVELFGYNSREEALNTRAISIYKNPEDRERFKYAIETNGFVKDFEFELKRKDGEPINGLITANLVKDKNGNSIAYRGIIRDITKQKKLEQQLVQAQKMEAIGTLAGGIAHDFNNILGVIIGYTELALDEIPPKSNAHQNMEQVLTAAGRAVDLVKQILAFSRQTDRKRRPLNLIPIIKETLKLMRSTIPANIEIRHFFNVEKNIIEADATQMHQVIINLCTNAAHAMKESGGILELRLDEVIMDEETISTHKDIKAGHYIRIMVSDTGHGIPEIVMKRIFEPYFTTKRTGEGTGMGLAVIHGIVKSHGGDITVFSQPGKGTTFLIFLPLIDAEVEEKNFPSLEIPGGTESILLIDDEVALVQAEFQALNKLGYKVETLSNPLEALQHFRENPDRYNLIISDIAMPRMTGIQLAMEIRRINPAIPIILSSGFSSSITIEQIKSLGIDDFVMKPIIKNELARIVRKALDKKQMPDVNPS